MNLNVSERLSFPDLSTSNSYQIEFTMSATSLARDGICLRATKFICLPLGRILSGVSDLLVYLGTALFLKMPALVKGDLSMEPPLFLLCLKGLILSFSDEYILELNWSILSGMSLNPLFLRVLSFLTRPLPLTFGSVQVSNWKSIFTRSSMDPTRFVPSLFWI